MRILVSTLAVILFAGFSAANAQRNDTTTLPLTVWEAGDQIFTNDALDPIITGQTLSSQNKLQWEMRKKRFLECGLCGLQQAYPGDVAK